MDIKKIQPSDTVNTKGIKMDSKKVVSALYNVQNAVKNLFKRAEREVPENLDFAPVKEVILNNNKEFHLKIIADPVDIRNSRRVILSAGIPEICRLQKAPRRKFLKLCPKMIFQNRFLSI